MLIWSVVLFGAAALGGVVMLGMRTQEMDIPLPLALGHGLLAAAGLVLLILGVLGGDTAGQIGLALGLFVAAALGGFVLFAGHLRSGTFPLGLAWIHGGAAAVALVLLLVGLLG